MFRVEMNKEEKCEGIVGYIRYSELRPCITNLPDIKDVDLSTCRSVEDLSSTKKRIIKRYMKEGYISDFRLLKKIHRRAGHFHGTVIVDKDGRTWGVLLVDSTADEDPFSEDVRTRFVSFALTIGEIIQMEV
ncbi:hypothetical protein ACFL3G_05065 [Planctomycetota bacterium]